MKKMPKGTNNPQGLEFNEQFVSAFDKLENENKNVFITGKAGTGKSTLLQYFRDHTIKNVAVLAPTGVAALNVKGQTIHSFFHFRPDITPEIVDEIHMRKAAYKLFRELDAIVIDEISMVRADLLDCIDAFLRLHGRHADEPFGGIQMIFFGDLFQLPPVVTHHEKELFKSYYKSPYYFDAKVMEAIDFEYVELSKVYRQKDEEFIEILNSIRTHKAEYNHLNTLNKRVNSSFVPQKDEFYIHLTTTNSMADQVNRRELAQLKGEFCSFEGKLGGKFDQRNLPTHETLNLKVGAQVMFLNNDPNKRWINGSLGTVSSLNGGDDDLSAIKIELANGKVVDVEQFSWEMFRFLYDETMEAVISEPVGSFTQYPLRLAWAVTIHKAQGKTFDKLILDIGRGTFAPGQLYVALSRCTSLDGLVLRKPVQKHHIILDEHVTNFTNLVEAVGK